MKDTYKPLHITYLSPESQDGCTWYRLTQLKKEAEKTKQAHIYWFSYLTPPAIMTRIFEETDVFVARLDETLHSILAPIIQSGKMNKPLVLDIDDSVHDIDPLSNHYQDMGTHEVQLADGTWLWKDKEREFDIEKNKKRIQVYEEFIRMADLVTVTTFELASYAKQYNPSVAIIPNAISPTLFPVVDVQKGGRVDIVWAGGSSHYPDLVEIYPILSQIIKKYPHVRYHHVGQLFDGLIKKLPQDQVVVHGWAHPEAHGYRMACIAPDIGIAPLKDSSFNRNKSSIKYYEYAALKTATIARNIPPYQDDIKHGVTGLLYDTAEDFRKNLETLIEDPIYRTKMGEGGYSYVCENRPIDKITRDWIQLLSGLAQIYENPDHK